MRRPWHPPNGWIRRDATVLALVPHFGCETWLADCLDALTTQTRPLDGIAVIDDASPVPPIEIVSRFPQVTLLQAEFNVGPYRLIQTVIEETAYDAYLFNDADDWSSPDRLEQLLETAEATGAELVGSWEVRIYVQEGEVTLVPYPEDVNEALRANPIGFPLLHPTSLVSRSLVRRIGGFASGMRFSGDAEFLRRAAYAARVVNVGRHLYLRRKRDGALTTSADTGLESSARREVQQQLWSVALSNAARAAAGHEPDLLPLTVAGPVALRHVAGPKLFTNSSRRSLHAYRT